MNILFLSLSRIENLANRGIYVDLIQEFIRRGHDVYIASPSERRFGLPTRLINNIPHCHILKIKTLNLQKTNVLEKGISTLLLEWQFDHAIRRYWGDVKFGLVLYSTPPITLTRVIERVKNRCGCHSYLMLKDIFPQNAVDLGMINRNGILYRMFRKKEKRLYRISERIGCMSPANCRYLLDHNSYIVPEKVEICPNAILPIPRSKITATEREELLHRYGIPSNKVLFVYGGNLGKPQGIDFLIKVLDSNENSENEYIIVVGSGTEYNKLQSWFDEHRPHNSCLLSVLPSADYNALLRTCHVGMIFLDPRFTIPNFPSRILSYMENSMPVLLATDAVTDMGRIAVDGGFGLWTQSGHLSEFMNHMRYLSMHPDVVRVMGQRAYEYMQLNYSVESVADTILSKI